MTTHRRRVFWGGALVAALAIYFLVSGLMSLQKARATANAMKCRSTLRALGQSMLLYANENRGAMPPSMGMLLVTQDITSEVFVCPGSSDRAAVGATAEERAASIDCYDGHCSYRYVGKGRDLKSLTADFVLAYELPGNHVGETCILYGDFHVERHPDATARKIIAEVEAGRNPPAVK